MRTWATFIATALLAFALAGAAEARGHAGKRAHAGRQGAAVTRGHAGKRAQAGRQDALAGRIQSVAPDGKSFVLATKGATSTVALADSTRVLVRNAKRARPQAATLAALQVGKHVRVTPATGTATSILIQGVQKRHRHGGGRA